MPVPPIDPAKRSDAYKKIAAVDGIAEQGMVPDPEVMHTLFSRMFAIIGPTGILPIIFAVNSCSSLVESQAALQADYSGAPREGSLSSVSSLGGP